MVPPDKERLRLSVMSSHTREQMDQAIDIIVEVAREFDAL